MHNGKRSGLILAVCLAIAGCRSTASGVYVQSSERSTTMVQLVETQNGHLTGRLENESFGDNGALSSEAGGIQGEIDGSQLVLRPQGLAGALGESLTGTIHGDTLEIFWGGRTLQLRRASTSTYTKERTRLQERAAVVVAKLETDQALATLAKTQAEIQSLDDHANEIIDRLAKVEANYGELSNGVTIRRQASAALNARGAEMAAAQADVQAEGILTQIEVLHTNVQQGVGQLGGRLEALGATLSKVRESCERRKSNLRDARFDQVCGQVVEQGRHLAAVAERLAPAAGRAEDAYHRAKAGA